MCILTVTDLLNLGLGKLNISNSQLVKEAASVACHVCMTLKGVINQSCDKKDAQLEKLHQEYKLYYYKYISSLQEY